MDLHRDIMEQLVEWKGSPGRKPLILQGARQIGKTWLMKHFGKRCFNNGSVKKLCGSSNICCDKLF